MFIDQVTIRVKAGDGGRGRIAFNKNAMALGPSGGRGGDGGSVYFEGVSNLDALRQFQHKREALAQSGENGKAQFNDGAKGVDLVVKLPIGSVIRVKGMRSIREIVHVGQQLLVAKGGHGGKGNFLFRSPRNTSPERFQEGLPGEEFEMTIELKLIADVGLVGLPNAGKSSLLNALTNAVSRVGSYQFTTLEPHLGVYYGVILADIPGLIEGASGGKGLGTKFLRHIERTRVLFHLVSADSDDLIRDYETIRKELGAHNPELLLKPEHIFITKKDLVSKQRIAEIVKTFKKKKLEAVAIAVGDAPDLDSVKWALADVEKTKAPPTQ